MENCSYISKLPLSKYNDFRFRALFLSKYTAQIAAVTVNFALTIFFQVITLPLI